MGYPPRRRQASTRGRWVTRAVGRRVHLGPQAHRGHLHARCAERAQSRRGESFARTALHSQVVSHVLSDRDPPAVEFDGKTDARRSGCARREARRTPGPISLADAFSSSGSSQASASMMRPITPDDVFRSTSVKRPFVSAISRCSKRPPTSLSARRSNGWTPERRGSYVAAPEGAHRSDIF